MYKKDRLSRGGGVCLIVSNIMPCYRVAIAECFSNAEIILAVNISFYSAKLRIIIGYNPSNSDSDYITNFCHCLDDLLNVDFTAVILGDFNFPDISWDMNTIPNQDSREFIFYDCCLNNGLQQLIHVPTYLYNQIHLILCSQMTLEAYLIFKL